MNQLRIFAGAALAVLLFSGCDKLKEERFSTTLIKDFEIDLPAGAPLVIDLEQTISALTNDELNEVKEGIKSYELKGLSYKVWEYWTDEPDVDILFNGTLGIGKSTASAPGVTIPFTDLSLLSSSAATEVVEVILNDDQIDKVEDYFLQTDGAKLFLDGNVSATPVHFILQVKVDVDAIAEVD